MDEILFVVEEADDSSYRASAVAAAIHTEADSLKELHREIRDASTAIWKRGRHRRWSASITGARNCWPAEDHFVIKGADQAKDWLLGISS